jgi:hypothetical protein
MFKVRRKNTDETYEVYQIIGKFVLRFALYDTEKQMWTTEPADNFVPCEEGEI